MLPEVTEVPLKGCTHNKVGGSAFWAEETPSTLLNIHASSKLARAKEGVAQGKQMVVSELAKGREGDDA